MFYTAFSPLFFALDPGRSVQAPVCSGDLYLAPMSRQARAWTRCGIHWTMILFSSHVRVVLAIPYSIAGQGAGHLTFWRPRESFVTPRPVGWKKKRLVVVSCLALAFSSSRLCTSTPSTPVSRLQSLTNALLLHPLVLATRTGLSLYFRLQSYCHLTISHTTIYNTHFGFSADT